MTDCLEASSLTFSAKAESNIYTDEFKRANKKVIAEKSNKKIVEKAHVFEMLTETLKFKPQPSESTI